MSNDVFESISQRVDGEETPQNRRISQVANELCRGCELYETQLRDGEGDGSFSVLGAKNFFSCACSKFLMLYQACH